MSAEPDALTSSLAEAFGHPARLQILRAVIRRDEVGPVEFSREADIAVGSAAYHFRYLQARALLTLARSESVRGARAHYYTVPSIDLRWRLAALLDQLALLEKTVRELPGGGSTSQRAPAAADRPRGVAS